MTENGRTGEVWILGATGRVGRAVAGRLAARGVAPVLVGRDHDRLAEAAADLVPVADTRMVVAGTAERIAAEIARQRPGVVVNTIGDYAATAPLVARACMPGGHYVDLANDLAAMDGLFALHQEAADAGSTLVTGAGFGVLATEAVVAKLCEGRPAPRRVRVDAVASVANEGGTMGAALAASVVDVFTTGGRRYEGGRLVRTRLAANPRQLTLPDGESAGSAETPSGELRAARAASGAPSVAATSALAPTGAAVRAVLPLAGVLLSVPAIRRLAAARLAGIKVKSSPRPRAHSWGHAVVEWPDGTGREGWLRAGDGMDYTADVATETAARLARGEGRPGVHTPAAALGADLAVAAGGTFVLD
ncbi:saccharopine dehydrogenase NADP-binding domain-containing protein [Streptomyces sp. NRRL F-5126]|uniref:saccharopine dehydrogenase NADP-binding domain-containing protein n=1 Tax=Streptomyces sp. NRRL F-5126 TaxID=1463857 RepID=UPI0004C7266A|nr:saccharopine dehydrogenase NADP-binding domain-containing protein [Streptomyces sp. NRRL F-5126]